MCALVQNQQQKEAFSQTPKTEHKPYLSLPAIILENNEKKNSGWDFIDRYLTHVHVYSVLFI